MSEFAKTMIAGDAKKFRKLVKERMMIDMKPYIGGELTEEELELKINTLVGIYISGSSAMLRNAALSLETYAEALEKEIKR